MSRALRVSVLAADAARERVLAGLVEASGHVVVSGACDVLLADADALPALHVPDPVPVVVLDEADADAPYAGILPVEPNATQLDAALRAAASGLVVRTMPRRRESGFRAADELPPLLTPREVEVLAAIGQGLSNKAVARRLGISAHTVKFHLEAAFRKLGASRRAEAVAKGLRRGLVEI